MFVPHMAEEFLEPSVKHFVSIKTLPFPIFHRILEALRVD